jgi:hypothetical protein
VHGTRFYCSESESKGKTRANPLCNCHVRCPVLWGSHGEKHTSPCTSVTILSEYTVSSSCLNFSCDPALFLPTSQQVGKPLQSTRARRANRMNCKVVGKPLQGFHSARQLFYKMYPHAPLSEISMWMQSRFPTLALRSHFVALCTSGSVHFSGTSSTEDEISSLSFLLQVGVQEARIDKAAVRSMTPIVELVQWHGCMNMNMNMNMNRYMISIINATSWFPPVHLNDLIQSASQRKVHETWSARQVGANKIHATHILCQERSIDRETDVL